MCSTLRSQTLPDRWRSRPRAGPRRTSMSPIATTSRTPARTDGKLSASVPINNRINGSRTIVFARRLEASNGNFVGIIYVSVNTKYFEDIYGSTQSVNDLLFTLVREDGTILFRHPTDSRAAGRKLSAEAAWLASLANNGDGFRILAQADGNVRYEIGRMVPEYPL